MADRAACIGGRRSRIGIRFGQIRVAFTILFSDRNGGKARFWERQWHVLAGRDHIKLTWKQHHEPARIVNAAGGASGGVAGAPVEIGARRSDDRRSRILCNHHAMERRNTVFVLNRQVGFNVERRPVIVQPINRNRPARRQRHTLCANRLAIIR